MRDGTWLWHGHIQSTWAWLSGRPAKVRLTTVDALFDEGLIDDPH
jgi:hypothetical protein